MRFRSWHCSRTAPRTGIELKQALEQRFGSVLPPLNAGQIYTTLSRLQRDGLVDDDAVAQDGRPNKRVYRLTDTGRDELRGWVEDSTPAARLKDDFFIKLVLAQAANIADWRELIAPPARRLSAGAARARRRRGQRRRRRHRRAARRGRGPPPRGRPEVARPHANDE